MNTEVNVAAANLRGTPPYRQPSSALAQSSGPSTTGSVGYISTPQTKPFIYMYDPGGGSSRENFSYDLREISISDSRFSNTPPNIHREGFELWDAPSQVRDFNDESLLEQTYYPECVELACRVTGAKAGFVFDHLLRLREQGRPPLSFGREGNGSTPAAVGRVHNDYTEASGRRRLGLVLKDASVASGVRRYSIVNIWRATSGPVLDTPLAVCDATTVQANDFVAAEIRYPSRNGEIYLAKHSIHYRWSYFSLMDKHEALVFKQFDSQLSGTSRFTPHAAFDLPNIPSDAPLRRSIEVRCLVIYD